MNNKTVGDITGFTTLIAADYSNIQTKVKAFYTEQKKLCPTLELYSTRLKSGINSIGFGNVLLQNGFCDLELDLINAFLNADSRIQWGGKFNSKIDGMHFGFTSSAAKAIVNKK